MSIEIKIPVHPAIPKFLAYRYKITPFLVTRLTPYGTILYNSLVKHQFKNAKDDVPINLAIYSQTLRLQLGQYTYQNKGWLMQPQKVLDFNKIVLDLIDQEFYIFMELHTRQGQKIYHTILTFREKYDFQEEDLAIKTLEKKYERHRQYKQLKISEKNL